MRGRIWEVATGKTLHILVGHTEYVPRVAFSPDGKYVLTGSVDRTARLWDAVTGNQIKVFSVPSGIESLTFSPDGKSIAFGTTDGKVQIWSIGTGQLIREFSGHHGYVQGIKFSPDGQTLLTVNADRTIRLGMWTQVNSFAFLGFTWQESKGWHSHLTEDSSPQPATTKAPKYGA